MTAEPKEARASRAAGGVNSAHSTGPDNLVAVEVLGTVHAGPSTFMAEEVAAFVAGNFCMAFVQALGKRAGDGFADLVWRRVRRKGKPDEIYIGPMVGRAATIAFTEDLPDEARLALLDLDVTAPELQGKLLRWDEETEAWRPSETLPSDSD